MTFGGTAMRLRWAIFVVALGLAQTTSAEPAPPYQDSQGHVVTPPHWIKKPSAEDLANYFPATAIRDGGHVRVSCAVTVRTTLDDCKVIEESPTGRGLGAAALMATSLFQMEPQLVDGVPTAGARVTIPFNFEKMVGAPAPAQTHKVTRSAAWSATPTAAEMAAAFPARAAGRSQAGRVILRCALTRDGRLTDCDTVSEEPTGMGFGAAARGLSKRFRLFDDPAYAKQIADYYVDVPFDFHDPSQPAKPLEMHDPMWLQTADPAMAGKLFPEEAAKTGLKTGRAFVVCQTAHDGALTGCTVAQEEPPGLGFGQAALAIAGVMKMNPWTVQGAPVDGARIRLPIRVNASAEPAAAAPPATASQH
jgi:TonB family protein